MLEEEGIVKEIHGDRAIITTVRKSECETCISRGACEIMGHGKEVRAEVLNPLGARPGQKVKVIIPEKTLLKSIFYLYFLPAILFMIGATAGYFSSGLWDINPDLFSIMGGAGGLFISFAVVYFLNRRHQMRNTYLPRIKEIIGEAEPDA